MNTKDCKDNRDNIVDGFMHFIKHEDLPFDITESILNTISYIEEIDKDITLEYRANLIERVDYYEYIYKREIFENLIEKFKDKPSWVNCFVYEAINIDFFKIIMYSEIIDNINYKIKNNTSDLDEIHLFEALKEVAIERKKECIISINHFNDKAVDLKGGNDEDENSLNKQDIINFVKENKKLFDF